MRESLRWSLALAGPLLFLASGAMPLLGGGAKWRARCAGREFTGEWDDCFTDALPALELLAPVVALICLFPFARFAFALFAPAPEQRTRRWRLASSSAAEEHWPLLHGIAAPGAFLAGWRATTYMFAAELWPFAAFWLVFAAWFIAGLRVTWPRRDVPDEQRA